MNPTEARRLVETCTRTHSIFETARRWHTSRPGQPRTVLSAADRARGTVPEDGAVGTDKAAAGSGQPGRGQS